VEETWLGLHEPIRRLYFGITQEAKA